MQEQTTHVPQIAATVEEDDESQETKMDIIAVVVGLVIFSRETQSLNHIRHRPFPQQADQKKTPNRHPKQENRRTTNERRRGVRKTTLTVTQYLKHKD